MQRTANAVWKETLKEGSGSISTQSGVLSNTPYGFNTRFENGPGTNPEELIGAAHAACFSMALSLELGKAGLTIEEINTHAAVTLEEINHSFSITAIHLDLKLKSPAADFHQIEQLANKTKESCPVSKVLNAKITLAVQLIT